MRADEKEAEYIILHHITLHYITLHDEKEARVARRAIECLCSATGRQRARGGASRRITRETEGRRRKQSVFPPDPLSSRHRLVTAHLPHTHLLFKTVSQRVVTATTTTATTARAAPRSGRA